jgi:trehalose/maltose transport system substrate-binding protein
VLAVFVVTATVIGSAAPAAELAIVSGGVGREIEMLRSNLDIFEARSGHKVKIVDMPSSTTDQFGQYRLWLSAHNSDVDVYRTDVIWAPQLASHLLDLSDAAREVITDHFATIIESQTVDGRLVAIPMFTDAPALYYRKDLLEKHDAEVPGTWEALATTARMIQESERAAGNARFHGFVFQGAAYEGLTCNALEWIKSHGGGQIVEADGSISIDNPRAAEAIAAAASWVNTIAPEGVLGYQEEDARGVWQTGNAAFMRNWPYAYALGNGDDSAVKGTFGVAPLPSGGAGSAATLGGWNLAVSRYSKHPQAAIELALFLTSEESQKLRATELSRLPTIPSLYDDPDVAAAQPIIPLWKGIFDRAVPRPSASTKRKYNEVSKEFWAAVHDTLSGRGTAESNLARLAARLRRLKRSGWK